MIGDFLLLCATLVLCIFLALFAKKSFEEKDYFLGCVVYWIILCKSQYINRCACKTFR